MAIQIRAPIADVIASGTWSGSAGTRYTLIDDFPDATTADILTHGTTTAGTIYFYTEASTVPSGSTIQSVQLQYYDYKNGTQACNFNGRLSFKNATLVTTGDAAHNPGNGIANVALRTHTWTTNPKTGAAWTDAEVNGNGTAANSLAGFGFISTDASPSISVTSAALIINYTTPVSGTTVFTLNSTLGVRANVSMNHNGATNLSNNYIFASSGTIIAGSTGVVHSGESSLSHTYAFEPSSVLNKNAVSNLSNIYTFESNSTIDKFGALNINLNNILATSGSLDKNVSNSLTNIYTIESSGIIDKITSAYFTHAYILTSNGTVTGSGPVVIQGVTRTINLFKSKLFNSNIFN